MDAALAADNLVQWIKDKTAEAGAQGVALGLSGGIDSAVVAALAARAFPDTTLGIIMPCKSIAQDIEHGRLVAEQYGCALKVIDLEPAFQTLLRLFQGAENEGNPLASSNIKPRLRMITLYYYAQQRNYLVLGTGNKSELTVGYFTKHGDGGVDLLPIGGLVKSQVRELARYLEVPREIIDKPPSAGLWEGQTDEGEMGLTYEELDRYILTGQGSEAVKARTETLNRISEHKRRPLPIGVF